MCRQYFRRALIWIALGELERPLHRSLSTTPATAWYGNNSHMLDTHVAITTPIWTGCQDPEDRKRDWADFSAWCVSGCLFEQDRHTAARTVCFLASCPKPDSDAIQTETLHFPAGIPVHLCHGLLPDRRI